MDLRLGTFALGFVILAYGVLTTMMPLYLIGHDVTGLVSSMMAGPVNWSAGLFRRQIELYQPASAVQAKRANEQIKFVANLFNAIAAGLVSVFAFHEFQQAKPSLFLVCIVAALALWVHATGRGLLALLKDEVV